jgi:acetate kinase
MKCHLFFLWVFINQPLIYSFKLPSLIKPSILPSKEELLHKNEEIYHNYDHLGKYKSWFEPNLFSSIHDYNEHSKDVLTSISHKVGNEAVKLISAGLPHVDSIGHNILHANDIYINSILNNDQIPHELQKTLILTSIKLAQYGDDMGSKLLTLYYNLVDYCL